MKKRVFGIIACVVLIFAAITLTACTGERDALQAQIDSLEAENMTLQSTISSLRSDLETAQAESASSQNELQRLLAEIEEAAAAEEQAADNTPSGPLAITFYGTPSTDRSWPLRDGVLEDVVALYVNWNVFDDDVEITWRSTNENVFTLTQSEDGISVIVTPIAAGGAELVVTVGDQETRSWLRIT